MKFCPECGSKFEEGITICEMCGYGKSEEEKEKIRNKEINPFAFYEQPTIEMQTFVPLEELKRRKLDIGNINSISYITSGGMLGDYYSRSLDFNTKELEITERTNHGSSSIKKYKVDDSNIDKIKKIIIDNNLPAWSEVHVDRRFIAYDAPSHNMYINTDNYNFTIPYNIFMDEEENKIFNDLLSLVQSLMKDENKISEDIDSFPRLGMMSNDEVDKLNEMNNSFCPECGSVLKDNKCTNCEYVKEN